MKREPKGSPTGGQFTPTHREEVHLQGVETLGQVHARLCPPHAEEYQDGGVRGAYYDADMTVDELEAKLIAAYEEAQEVGLIDSDIDISIETYEGEVHITVAHPDEGIYEDNSHTVSKYSDGLKETLTICNNIRNAYALIDYDDYGYERVRKNTALIYLRESPAH